MPSLQSQNELTFRWSARLTTGTWFGFGW